MVECSDAPAITALVACPAQSECPAYLNTSNPTLFLFVLCFAARLCKDDHGSMTIIMKFALNFLAPGAGFVAAWYWYRSSRDSVRLPWIAESTTESMEE